MSRLAEAALRGRLPHGDARDAHQAKHRRWRKPCAVQNGGSRLPSDLCQCRTTVRSWFLSQRVTPSGLQKIEVALLLGTESVTSRDGAR